MSENIWEVDEEALNKQIFKDFKKTKKDLLNDIDIMRKWTKTQLHFPEEPSEQLLRFVILLNKFSIEKAKQKLDMYYTIRTVLPEFYKSVPLSPRMILQSKVLYWVLLPKATPDFKRIVYVQLNPNYGPEYFNHEQCNELFCNLNELMVYDDRCYSYHFILDLKGIQLGHVPKVKPMVLRNVSILLERVYTNRLASIYLVNFVKFMEMPLNNIFKPLLSPKIRDRITIHSGTDILLEVFGKSAMPKDIGGEERSLDELNDCILKKFEERKERFETLRTLRIDESLRPQKLVNDEVLGYYGNFKAINVD